MARKSTPASHASADRTAGSLKNLRQQIDKLDLQILDLINKRASLAAKIGELKHDQGNNVFAPAREEEVIANLLRANKGPMPEVSVRAIYREIISASRALQRVLKVAFLGPEYSFSHLATLQRFGEAVEMMEVGSIAAVFEEVNRRHVDYGVVPLENSTDGRVADTLDMFIRLPQLKICSEVRMRIHHCLLANCEQTEIRRVYSKPQALSQCRNWLSKNVPHASLHEVTSTSAACRLVQTEPHVAAVASRQAAVRYGLRILFSDIEDSPHNETRFAVIGLQDAAKTGRDKTAIMFQIPHSPGSLADVLILFKQNKVNLTWIESFPYRSAKGEYVFFVEFEGHTDDPKIKKTLAALERQAFKLSVLGSFPMAQPVD
ncbi:MAG TPA: prephenate dehydratase [Gemmataceae bacterium]